MKTSRAGIELIKKYEGLRLEAYYCPANILTIGYGHTSAAGLPQVYEGMTITAKTAETVLKRDLESFEKAVNDTAPPSISQSQFDALVSFTFNCGEGALKTLTRNRSLAQIARVMPLYNKSAGIVLAGLTKRRNEEVALFWSDADMTGDKPDDKPQEKTIGTSKTIGAGGVVAGITLAKEALQQAKEAKGQIGEILGDLSTLTYWNVGLTLAVVALAGFIIYERVIKIKREGV